MFEYTLSLTFFKNCWRLCWFFFQFSCLSHRNFRLISNFLRFWKVFFFFCKHNHKNGQLRSVQRWQREVAFLWLPSTTIEWCMLHNFSSCGLQKSVRLFGWCWKSQKPFVFCFLFNKKIVVWVTEIRPVSVHTWMHYRGDINIRHFFHMMGMNVLQLGYQYKFFQIH